MIPYEIFRFMFRDCSDFEHEWKFDVVGNRWYYCILLEWNVARNERDYMEIFVVTSEMLAHSYPELVSLLLEQAILLSTKREIAINIPNV